MVEYTSDHPDSDLALCMVYKEKSKLPKAIRKEKEKAEKALASAKHAAAMTQLKAKAPARDATTATMRADLLDEIEAVRNNPQQGHVELIQMQALDDDDDDGELFYAKKAMPWLRLRIGHSGHVAIWYFDIWPYAQLRCFYNDHMAIWYFCICPYAPVRIQMENS
ncbi:hypothetical protein Tco_0038582 [Tanacetum coccineum]